MNIILCVLLLLVFGWLDVEAYTSAKFPERSFNPLYKFPGGGFVARWKLGKK